MQLKVYVVEDNAVLRENLVGTLEELTCVKVVGSSSTEDEAVAWLERNGDQWDMAIVDLFLKQGSGINVVQRVVRQRPTQKLSVFSNYVNPGVRKRCAQIGVDAVFDKSTEIDSLVDYCAVQCARLETAATQAAQAHT